MPLMEDVALSKALRGVAKSTVVCAPLATDGRRWDQGGWFRTVLRMWGFTVRLLGRGWSRSFSRLLRACQRALISSKSLPRRQCSGELNAVWRVSWGESAALHWYRVLLARTLATARELVDVEIEVWRPAEDDDYPLMELINDASVGLYPQASGDLGQKMFNALEVGLTRSERVLPIGADCPVWTTSLLRQAPRRNIISFRAICSSGGWGLCRCWRERLGAALVW